MLGGRIFHHNSHYISHLLSSILLAFSLLSGWLSVYKSPIVFAADASPIVADPAHTQDFFSAFGDASVQRAADGSWSQVVLTPAQVNQAGAVTLNNRLDFSKDFNLKYSMKLGAAAGQGDGLSFALYPGQLGAVGMFGGNMGVAGLPNALGFKFDNYTNQTDNMVTNGTNVDTEFGFGRWATQVSKPGTPSYVAGQINPYTNTVKYAEHLRQNNSSGAVWGTVDQQLQITAPYGSIIETNEAGYLKIMAANSNHLFLRNNVKDPLPQFPITTQGIGVKVNTGPSGLTTDLADGKWHNVQIDYQVANGIGNLTVSLYRDTTYTNLNKSWTASINIAEMMDKTNKKPYFALNIAGSNGSSTANQAVKNLYAKYTPEPGAFTTRFVDENGTTIKDAINQGGADKPNQPISVDIPKTISTSRGDFVLDYASLEVYDKETNNDKIRVDVSSGQFTSPYAAAYRRLNVHYRKKDGWPTAQWSITDGIQTVDSKTGKTFSTKQAVTPSVTYTYTLALPATAPNPWSGVNLQTMVPAGLSVFSAKLRTTQNGSTAGASAAGKLISMPNGQTQVVFNPIDLYGTAKDAQPNTAQVELVMTPSVPLTGAIETTVTDTYIQDVTGDAQQTSYWVPPLPKTTTQLEITGSQVVTSERIAMPDRSKPTLLFTQAQLHLPAGATQVTKAVRWTTSDGLPNGLLADDVKINQQTGNDNLTTFSLELTPSGQKKLMSHDDVMVAVLFTGQSTTNGSVNPWVVNYTLYEPLSTWMPDSDLAKLVGAQLPTPLTASQTLQKSMMPTLTKFVGDRDTWTITQDPTGLEYATKLQSFTAPGKVSASGKENGSFRRLINTFSTNRGQTGVPADTLTALDLSGYSKDVFVSAGTVTDVLPTLPKLTAFTATQDGLEPALLSKSQSTTQTNDLAAFFQKQVSSLKTVTFSNNEPAAENTNPNQISTLLTGPATIDKINQTNMIVPGIALTVAADKNNPNKITITSPKDGNGNAIDLRTKLSTLALDSGATVPFTAADAANTTVEFFDQGTSTPSNTNADLTKFIDTQHPGQLNIKYQDYVANAKSTTGTGYLRFSYPKNNTTYSLWMPTMIKGQTAITVSGSLDFGTRRLAAGDYPNDGHNDIAGTKPAEPATPIKITTVYNPKSQVTVAVSPFQDATKQSTVNSLVVRLGAGNAIHDIPANGLEIALPELTNDKGSVDTQAYTAILHVPNTTGILPGQKYNATVRYTLTDGL